MRKPVVRKSLRQTVTENQEALDFMSKLAGGDGHVNKVVFKEPRKIAIKGPAVYPSEAEVQNAILQYLRVHPKVAFAIRINSGGAIETYNGVERYISYHSQKGLSDIFGVMKGGKAYFLEVKSKTGRLSPDQDAFLVKALDAGALAGCVRSIEDVEKVLQLK
jgi:hypothetical protein